VKQLYCTTAEGNPNGTDKPVPHVRVRAASGGLAPERVRAALRHAGYASPVRGPAAASAPPARLALLQTREAGRFLCHSTCLGIDPATGQNGHFFSHLLLDVPATLDAQHAIQSWGSPLWQRTDHGGGAELPEALYLPVSSTLGDAELAEFLTPPAHRELLQFVLATLLTTPPEACIFLAAPVETVARCLYGVTRALPPSLLESFTFSTYERDPLGCPARVVGTCWDDAPDLDLPAACYAGPGVGFNTYTGRKSELPAEVPFVEFAVTALARKQTQALDEFHATWQRLGVKDAGLFELVYRLARGTGALTKEESQQVLQHPTLCAWVAVRPDALGQFLEWALDDQAYATATFSRAVAALRQKPEVLARLAQTVQERGLAALRAGDLTRTRNALEALMPMVAPARSATVWGELLTTLTDPDALTWELRGYLLPQFARLRPQGTEPDLRRWLSVPAERLGALLALDLPEACRREAGLACLARDGEPTPVLARTLAAHPALVLAALQQLPGQPDGEARALALFRAVLAEAPRHAWGEDVVRAGRSLPGTLLDRCVEAALDAGNTRACDLVAAGHGPALRELLANRPSLDRLADQLLSRPQDNLQTDRGRGEFLQALAGAEGLRPEVRARLDACLGFLAFLRQPTLERAALEQVAAALRVEPPLFAEAVRGQVVGVVAVELGRRRGETVQADLETVLLALGASWPGGTSALYRALLHDRQGRRGFWKQADLLHAFLAVALGAAQSAELAGQLDNLDAEAYGLAHQVARVGGRRVLAAIEQRTAAWPRATRSQWGFLSRAVRPRGLGDRVRDALLVAGGIAAGAAGVLALQWFGVW
jgi:GTPase-associated protein 1, N-terminal domain type 2/GTPase-associated protein 1, middle domain